MHGENELEENNPMSQEKITAPTLPPDDLQRSLTLVKPNEDQSLPHIGLAGDTYTILLSGKDTNDKYCLIDMHIPPGGGPPPHQGGDDLPLEVLPQRQHDRLVLGTEHVLLNVHGGSLPVPSHVSGSA